MRPLRSQTPTLPRQRTLFSKQAAIAKLTLLLHVLLFYWLSSPAHKLLCFCRPLQDGFHVHCKMASMSIARWLPCPLQDGFHVHCKMASMSIARWLPGPLQDGFHVHSNMASMSIARWTNKAKVRLRCKII